MGMEKDSLHHENSQTLTIEWCYGIMTDTYCGLHIPQESIRSDYN